MDYYNKDKSSSYKVFLIGVIGLLVTLLMIIFGIVA